MGNHGVSVAILALQGGDRRVMGWWGFERLGKSDCVERLPTRNTSEARDCVAGRGRQGRGICGICICLAAGVSPE